MNTTVQEPPKTRTGERRIALESFAHTPPAAQRRVEQSCVEHPTGSSGVTPDEAAISLELAGGPPGERHAHGADEPGSLSPGPDAPDDPRTPDHPSRPIKVLIADDHAMVREGMAQMLSLNDDIQVVAQARDGREAVALAREIMPDVAILDVEMPVMGGQAAVRRLLEFSTPPKVIVVTVFADRRLVSEILGLGASAFLAKSASSRDLAATVRAVARNPDSENVIVAVPRSEIGEEEPEEGLLSQRETEILRLVARGASNKDVSETMHISETTVKRDLSNVYDKAGVRTRGEAVSHAVAEGWISSWDIVRDDGPSQ